MGPPQPTRLMPFWKNCMANSGRLTTLLVCIPLLVILSGCGIIDYYFLPTPEDTARELFEAGDESMREKQYTLAVEYFTKLKDRYPFSPYTPRAELALGDAYFLNKEYILAAEAYKEFEALHPRHEQAPYVLFQIGLSDFKTFDSIDRPQADVIEALEYFYRLRDTHPDSPYASNASEYILKCRRILADHELFVADFYWRSESYRAAWSRYLYVAKNFSDLPDVFEYAGRRAEMAYLLYQKSQSRLEREKREGSWKDMFDWL